MAKPDRRALRSKADREGTVEGWGSLLALTWLSWMAFSPLVVVRDFVLSSSPSSTVLR